MHFRMGAVYYLTVHFHFYDNRSINTTVKEKICPKQIKIYLSGFSNFNGCMYVHMFLVSKLKKKERKHQASKMVL